MNMSMNQKEIKKCHCLLCKMKMVVLQNKYIPWITLSRIFYLSLMSLHPEKQYFSVKTVIPNYIKSHWEILSKLTQFNDGAKWRKSMLDSINPSRFFQSGKDHFKISGYWKLKDTSIPFVENICSDECSDSNQMSPRNGEMMSNEDSFIVQSNEWSDQQNSGYQPQMMNQFQQSQNALWMQSQKQNVVSMQQYYLINLQMIRNNTQVLIQMYQQNVHNVLVQQQIAQEIQRNEELMRKYSEELYKISDCNDGCYSSSCLVYRYVC